MPLVRTILRRTVHTTAAVSTLLLLATLILWPVSYYRSAGLNYVSPWKTHCSLISEYGRVHLDLDWPREFVPTGFYLCYGPVIPIIEGHWSYLAWNDPTDPDGNSLGFSWATFSGVSKLYMLSIPFSYLTLLFSLLPLLAFRSICRRRQAARVARLGLCPKCHYDLRAHHSGAAGPLCPECGTLVAPNNLPLTGNS